MIGIVGNNAEKYTWTEIIVLFHIVGNNAEKWLELKATTPIIFLGCGNNAETFLALSATTRNNYYNVD